jgi:hypothetical protein
MVSPFLWFPGVLPRQVIPDVKPQLILHFQFGRDHLHPKTPSRDPGHSAFGDADRLLDAREIYKERQIHAALDEVVASDPDTGFRNVAHHAIPDQHVSIAHSGVHEAELGRNTLGPSAIVIRRLAGRSAGLAKICLFHVSASHHAI